MANIARASNAGQKILRTGSQIVKLGVSKMSINIAVSGKLLSTMGKVLPIVAKGAGIASLSLSAYRIMYDPKYGRTEATLDIVFGVAGLFPPTAILGVIYTGAKFYYQEVKGGKFDAPIMGDEIADSQ